MASIQSGVEVMPCSQNHNDRPLKMKITPWNPVAKDQSAAGTTIAVLPPVTNAASFDNVRYRPASSRAVRGPRDRAECDHPSRE